MEILIVFIIAWIVIGFIISAAWMGEAHGDDKFPMEFFWWPIWLVTVGLMRVLKSIKRAISDEWKKS